MTDEKNIDVKVGSAKLGFIILPNCFGGQKDILFSQVAIGQKDILFSQVTIFSCQNGHFLFKPYFSPPHINLTKKKRLSTKENTADEKTLKSISNTKTDTQTNKT